MVLWLWSFSYGYDASTMVLQPDAARLRGSVMGWCLFKLAEMCIEAITVKCSVEINSWAFQIGLQLNSERISRWNRPCAIICERRGSCMYFGMLEF